MEAMQKIRRFDSPEEFSLYCQNTAVNSEGICGRKMASDNNDGHGGADVKTFKQAVKKSEEGDLVMAQTIKPKDIELSHHGRMTCTHYDTSGDFVDMGRFLSGEPECMGASRRLGKPIINIMVNITVGSFISPKAIIERGKAILEIMSGLESNGYGVQITLYSSVNRYQEYYIKVKDPKEYFNLQSLAFWLISPSVFRKFVFRALETESTELQQAIGFGYGRQRDIDQKELDEMPDCVYFPLLDDNGGKYTGIIQTIMEKYKA
jgi:hypothetical protein